MRCAPRGRAETTAAARVTVAAAAGGLNAEHEEGAPRRHRPPHGHAPASAHWSAVGGGQGCFGPISRRQRTANGRSSTASRAGSCGCAMKAFAYPVPWELSR